ncbi:MAG: hypothetical protein ACI9G1_003986, partial [Pirellulaceae bacterium]
RPTLTVTYPQKGSNDQPLDRLLIGMHDYYTGLDKGSLEVLADFPIDDAAAQVNLASRFRETSSGVWELKLNRPIKSLKAGKLIVSVKDIEGNTSRIERTFAIK